jgi:hypothetical protein
LNAVAAHFIESGRRAEKGMCRNFDSAHILRLRRLFNAA